MPTRDSAPVGSPCWVDLATSDANSARAFYGHVLGWESEEPNEQFGGYFNFTRNGVRTAGCMSAMPDSPHDIWSVYLATDDAAKTVEAAGAAGAKVVVPAMQVGELGVMAVLIDPTGASVGMWQPSAFPGLTVLGEHGTPGWFELHTRDYEGALDFYRSVFHWETDVMSDSDEFRYSTMRDPSGDGELAGVMDASGFLPDGVPAHWSVYFSVDDTDAALSRSGERGGSTLRPAEDTPYGRLATAADPAGAQFKLMARN
jgi:predicted enzyme related to lactoylglutathione lyase